MAEGTRREGKTGGAEEVKEAAAYAAEADATGETEEVCAAGDTLEVEEVAAVEASAATAAETAEEAGSRCNRSRQKKEQKQKEQEQKKKLQPNQTLRNRIKVRSTLFFSFFFPNS